MSIYTFSEYFAKQQDPRQTAKVAHPLFDVLFLTLSAVIGGVKDGGILRTESPCTGFYNSVTANRLPYWRPSSK